MVTNSHDHAVLPPSHGALKQIRVLTALILAMSMAAPASASASTGSIEGVTVEPSLAHASVQNLSVTFDGCSAEDPTCSWDAHAWLVAPPRTACPPNGSELMLAAEHPPGLPPPPPSEQPWLGTRQVWHLESKGDGSLQSGPLQLNLEGVDDQYLCLYVTEPPAASVYTASRGAQPAYTAEPERAPLLASQLLYVDKPVATVPLASPAPAHVACGPARATTILGGRQARIYSLPGADPPQTERIFGCLASTGRSRKLRPISLGRRYGKSMSTPFVLRAPWIAGAGWTSRGVDGETLTARAVNLRTGASGDCFVGARPGGVGHLTGIVLKRNGSLAWAGYGRFGPPPRKPAVPEVVACDSEGERVLDSGAGIDLHSLSLHGSELSWSDSGATRMALLR